MSIQKSIIRGTQWINHIGSEFLLNSVSGLRAGSGAGAKRKIEPKGLHWEAVEANGVPCELIKPAGAPDDAILLYLPWRGRERHTRDLAHHVA